MKLKLIAPILCCMFTSLITNAQKAAMSVYGELGGPGLASVNFDTRFQKTNGGLGGRIGVGGIAIDQSSILFIPVGINYLAGKDDKNFFELGAGFTYVNAKDKESLTSESFESSFGHLWIGYRLQPKDGGVTFRAGINPVFGNGFFIPYYAGLSIGYKF